MEMQFITSAATIHMATLMIASAIFISQPPFGGIYETKRTN
jgi:hypothetical protein